MVEYEIGGGENDAQTHVPLIIIYIHVYIYTHIYTARVYHLHNIHAYIYMYLKAYIYSFLEGQFRRVKGIISAE